MVEADARLNGLLGHAEEEARKVHLAELSAPAPDASPTLHSPLFHHSTQLEHMRTPPPLVTASLAEATALWQRHVKHHHALRHARDWWEYTGTAAAILAWRRNGSHVDRIRSLCEAGSWLHRRRLLSIGFMLWVDAASRSEHCQACLEIAMNAAHERARCNAKRVLWRWHDTAMWIGEQPHLKSRAAVHSSCVYKRRALHRWRDMTHCGMGLADARDVLLVPLLTRLSQLKWAMRRWGYNHLLRRLDVADCQNSLRRAQAYMLVCWRSHLTKHAKKEALAHKALLWLRLHLLRRWSRHTEFRRKSVMQERSLQALIAHRCFVAVAGINVMETPLTNPSPTHVCSIPADGSVPSSFLDRLDEAARPTLSNDEVGTHGISFGTTGTTYTCCSCAHMGLGMASTSEGHATRVAVHGTALLNPLFIALGVWRRWSCIAALQKDSAQRVASATVHSSKRRAFLLICSSALSAADLATFHGVDDLAAAAGVWLQVRCALHRLHEYVHFGKRKEMALERGDALLKYAALLRWTRFHMEAEFFTWLAESVPSHRRRSALLRWRRHSRALRSPLLAVAADVHSSIRALLLRWLFREWWVYASERERRRSMIVAVGGALAALPSSDTIRRRNALARWRVWHAREALVRSGNRHAYFSAGSVASVLLWRGWLVWRRQEAQRLRLQEAARWHGRCQCAVARRALATWKQAAARDARRRSSKCPSFLVKGGAAGPALLYAIHQWQQLCLHRVRVQTVATAIRTASLGRWWRRLRMWISLRRCLRAVGDAGKIAGMGAALRAAVRQWFIGALRVRHVYASQECAAVTWCRLQLEKALGRWKSRPRRRHLAVSVRRGGVACLQIESGRRLNLGAALADPAALAERQRYQVALTPLALPVVREHADSMALEDGTLVILEHDRIAAWLGAITRTRAALRVLRLHRDLRRDPVLLWESLAARGALSSMRNHRNLTRRALGWWSKSALHAALCMLFQYRDLTRSASSEWETRACRAALRRLQCYHDVGHVAMKRWRSSAMLCALRAMHAHSCSALMVTTWWRLGAARAAFYSMRFHMRECRALLRLRCLCLVRSVQWALGGWRAWTAARRAAAARMARLYRRDALRSVCLRSWHACASRQRKRLAACLAAMTRRKSDNLRGSFFRWSVVSTVGVRLQLAMQHAGIPLLVRLGLSSWREAAALRSRRMSARERGRLVCRCVVLTAVIRLLAANVQRAEAAREVRIISLEHLVLSSLLRAMATWQRTALRMRERSISETHALCLSLSRSWRRLSTFVVDSRYEAECVGIATKWHRCNLQGIGWRALVRKAQTALEAEFLRKLVEPAFFPKEPYLDLPYGTIRGPDEPQGYLSLFHGRAAALKCAYNAYPYTNGEERGLGCDFVRTHSTGDMTLSSQRTGRWGAGSRH